MTPYLNISSLFLKSLTTEECNKVSRDMENRMFKAIKKCSLGNNKQYDLPTWLVYLEKIFLII